MGSSKCKNCKFYCEASGKCWKSVPIAYQKAMDAPEIEPETDASDCEYHTFKDTCPRCGKEI